MKNILLTLGLLSCLASCNDKTTALDPSRVNLSVVPIRYQVLSDSTGYIELEYKVINENPRSIFLVDFKRMPYVIVVDSAAINLEFRIAVPPDPLAIFEQLTLVELKTGDSTVFRFSVDHPFRPCDHYNNATHTIRTSSRVDLKVIQGYGDSPFKFDPRSYSLYQDFLTFQKIIETKPVTLEGLVPGP